MDDLAGWHLVLDGIKETDELLMRVSLHGAAEDDAVEDIEGGKQGGRAVPLVVVGHGAAPAGLERQTGLGSIERLNLAHMGICESRFSVQDVIDKSPVVTSYPRSEPVCMTRPVCRGRFKLTSGRRYCRLHQYPACVGQGLRRAGPFFSSAFLSQARSRSAHLDPPGVIRRFKGARAGSQAAVVSAPSGTIPAVTYFQKAISSFLARATISTLRIRPPLSWAR